MYKRKWGIVTILLAFVLLLIMSNTALGATDEEDVWNTKIINENKKVWTISFSQPLKESSVKNASVYVEDENYRLFFTDVTVSSDKKSIIVTPKDVYQENKTYRLNISKDVTSAKGEKISKKIILPFILDDSTGNENPDTINEAISNVKITSTAFASLVTATSDDSVNRVTANYKDMHYEGNNTFSLGITGLDSGDNVKIEAYDINGKKVFSKNFKVN
ncbi:Ig-like domain-containing protein [Niallia oryzisoli]|uniref:Ig-like domain-containing protein n=1 Tax=Niallia oryzisoli TaxID=1737571 RepID=A0ABZ2CCF9_9BACI